MISLIEARVAQLVEHWSNKPTVAGSIPVVSIYFFFTLSHALTYKMYIHTLLSLHLPTGNVKNYTRVTHCTKKQRVVPHLSTRQAQ